ncbi:MAG TPA: MarR family winged helix-turn-helix transcriptional regulator [Variovorax sp.]
MELTTTNNVVSACTCGRLRRLTRRMTALHDRALAPAGLQLTQFSLLSTLRCSSEAKGIRVTELAEAMDMDRTTLTRNLRPLIALGLLRLELDAADSRARRVVLTTEGIGALRRANPYWALAQQHVSDVLGPENVLQLHAWLDLVTPAFRESSIEGASA